MSHLSEEMCFVACKLGAVLHDSAFLILKYLHSLASPFISVLGAVLSNVQVEKAFLQVVIKTVFKAFSLTSFLSLSL